MAFNKRRIVFLSSNSFIFFCFMFVSLNTQCKTQFITKETTIEGGSSSESLNTPHESHSIVNNNRNINAADSNGGISSSVIGNVEAAILTNASDSLSSRTKSQQQHQQSAQTFGTSSSALPSTTIGFMALSTTTTSPTTTAAITTASTSVISTTDSTITVVSSSVTGMNQPSTLNSTSSPTSPSGIVSPSLPPFYSNELFTVPTTIRPLNLSLQENRLRWVNSPMGDFRRHQAYPPRMPNVPGIPSGFRNPMVTSTPPPLQQQFPSLLQAQQSIIAASAIVSSTQSPQQSSSIITASGSDPSMFNPGAHHSFFGGASSNPISFGGSVIMDEEPPFKLSGVNRRYNITRVEHITAECSDEYMKVVIRFNGTFTGLIYSSGYVHDPNCIYVNGSGRSYYEFFIRLNQCGTLGRQEMYHPTMPGEARRRDQLMWNTLSIQYNAMIEEEFDEHFRLTCEYGSDFWKTVSFPSVGVEVNTGSPVVFTINPPQCQMEIRRGFGIAGTRTAGPVTVGDPLTLLIHMKSEKAGFDILVKNCVAHNGAQQRMQLIDSNGCVTNEKLISPFRGTYNSENGHQVSLYSYLKAFRFTGSPALYLECDIHMCHNRCPPQRCYWRNLAKRSADLAEYEQSFNETTETRPVVSESISLFQALEVYHDQDQTDSEPKSERSSRSDTTTKKDDKSLICLRSTGIIMVMGAFVMLMFLSIGTSICYCLRMRRVRYFQHNLIQTARHFNSNSSCRSSEYAGFSTPSIASSSTTSDYGWLSPVKHHRAR